MTTAFFIAWIVIALLVTGWNIYVQLVMADNWPPTNHHSIAWEAVGMLLTLCLAFWPIVLVCMWLDNQRPIYRRALKARRERQVLP